MQTSQEITLPCDLLVKTGRSSADGVPFQWLETWVQELRAKIPDDEEGNCVVTGTQHLVARYTHVLTPLESMQAQRDELLGLARQMREVIRLDGSMSADQVERLAELLKQVP
jgi:hypothetical protein